MIQHRVFVANTSTIDIDINDANVQSILKSGNHVAYINDDVLHYALDPDQSEWFIPEGTGKGSTVAAKNQNIYNASNPVDEKGSSISSSGDAYEYYHIEKELKKDASGNEWYVFTVSDRGFKHEDLITWHDPYSVLAYAYTCRDTDDLASMVGAKNNFENVLSMIFQMQMTSVNHNMDNVPKTLDPNAPIRKYSENNIVSYGIHTDQLVLEDGDSHISFDNVPAGQYMFMIAKIIHADGTNINDIQKISISASNATSKCFFTKLLITKNSYSVLSENYIGCDRSGLNVSITRNDNVTEVYINITFDSNKENNRWVCNASVSGSEHARFPKALGGKFHTVVGTSYDCFKSDVSIYDYTAANAGTYQERYTTHLMFSKGYPYMITISLQKDEKYEYDPKFDDSSSVASWDLKIDGKSVKKYVTISDDKRSIIYDAGYEIPIGAVSFVFIDTYKNREYTAEISVNDAGDLSYDPISTPLGIYNNHTLTKTVSRGQANLNSIDSIAFVAFVADKSQSTASAEWDSVGYDLDSNLSNPNSSGGSTYLTYNTPTATMLGWPMNTTTTSDFDVNEAHVSQYCSCDCLATGPASVFSFPYVVIDSVADRIQYKDINDIIQSALSGAGWTSDMFGDYSAAMKIINSVTKNKITITMQELNDTDENITKLCTLIAYKLKESWNGELATRELYCFYTLGSYLDDYHDFEFQFIGYRGNGIVNKLWSQNRRIYILLFTMDRNKKKDDDLNIQFNDIKTTENDTVYYIRGSQISRANEPIELQYNGHRYKLVGMQDVNRRVIAEQSFMFDLTDINDDNHQSWSYRNNIISTCYKIEPIDGEEYDEDDYFLEGYNPNKQSVGKWLMINHILFENKRDYNPTRYAYDNATHIFTDGDCSYYATSKALESTSGTPDDDFIKSATEVGLPAFAVVEFKKKGLNDLKNNLGDFVRQRLRAYVNEKLSSGISFTDIPGISSYSEANQYTLTSLNDTAAYNDGTTFGEKLVGFFPKQSSDTPTVETIRFYYNPDDKTDTQNFEILHISGYTSATGNDVIYGTYRYDSNIDDWVFNFNVATEG